MNKGAEDIHTVQHRMVNYTKFQETKFDSTAVRCVRSRYLWIIFYIGTHKQFIEAAQNLAPRSKFSNLYENKKNGVPNVDIASRGQEYMF